ncbi:MAG: hypothetical protein ACYC5U_01660 [Rhodocyclaceae bacterium]
MSALYGLALIGIWLGLTTWFWKVWRRVRAQPDANRRAVDATGIVFAALWLGVSFWYGGGRTVYYDMQVRELCAKDGGVKVYETVRLPASEYNRHSRKNWILPNKTQMTPTDEYFSESETLYYRKSNPQFARTVARIVRRSDGKALGEYIHYGRGGGDLLGPWHGTSYLCPDPTKSLGFETKIFMKEE